jgi:hypothetical protein
VGLRMDAWVGLPLASGQPDPSRRPFLRCAVGAALRPDLETEHGHCDWLRFNCGTGFSREGVGSYTGHLPVCQPASSRLKPVPQ